MQNRSIRLYVGIIVAISAGSFLWVDWSVMTDLSWDARAGLLSLVILGLISESLSLTVKVGGNSGSSSITFLPLLTAVQLFGPVPGLVLHAATGMFGEVIVRRTEPIKAIFNISQWLFSTVVAGLAFHALGGVPQAALGELFAVQLVPLIAFGVVFLAINQTAVAGAITVNENICLSAGYGDFS